MQKETQPIRDIFKKRVNIKPYEYPEMMAFKDAIRFSYWLHTEYNFEADVQDFKVNITDMERTAITKVFMAISQIEVNVKRFWGNIYNIFPKPEIDDIGGTFAESEVRHKDAYSHLLEILGMNDMFENVGEIPVIADRYKYLEKIMNQESDTPDEAAVKVILFAELIEGISLFGLFYIMMSYYKRLGLFSGINNVVSATSLEEEVHRLFGVYLFRIIKEEHPYIKNSQFIEDTLKTIIDKALLAEDKILDWIFEDGDLPHVSKEEVRNFVLGRFNIALEQMELDNRFETDTKLDNDNLWFYEVIKLPADIDFFKTVPTDYTKGSKSFTKDDLF